MLPYNDDNPTLTTPVVTFLIIGVNALVWILIQGMGAEPQLSRSVCQLGLVPGEVLHRLPPGTPVPTGPGLGCVTGSGNAFLTLFTLMFLHGGCIHLIWTAWSHWVLGSNVEDAKGPA